MFFRQTILTRSAVSCRRQRFGVTWSRYYLGGSPPVLAPLIEDRSLRESATARSIFPFLHGSILSCATTVATLAMSPCQHAGSSVCEVPLLADRRVIIHSRQSVTVV